VAPIERNGGRGELPPAEIPAWCHPDIVAAGA
jgi:hypothetical protein